MEILDSLIKGSQRLILPIILDNIPKDIKTICLPFACGQELTYALKERGYTIYANDRLYYSYLVGEGVVNCKESFFNIFTDKDSLSVEGYLSKINKKLNYPCDERVAYLIDDIILSSGKNLYVLASLGRTLIEILPHGWEDISNLFKISYDDFFVILKRNMEYFYNFAKKGMSFPGNAIFSISDAFEFLNQVLSTKEIDLLYYGTPTILSNTRKGRCFYLRYNFLESVLQQKDITLPLDWDKRNTLEKQEQIIKLFLKSGGKVLICGWGSGEETLKQRRSLLKKYFSNVVEFKLEFVGFEDFVFICELNKGGK